MGAEGGGTVVANWVSPGNLFQPGDYIEGRRAKVVTLKRTESYILIGQLLRTLCLKPGNTDTGGAKAYKEVGLLPRHAVR